MGKSCHARACTAAGGGWSVCQPLGKGGSPEGMAWGHGGGTAFAACCCCAAFVNEAAFACACAAALCLAGSREPFASVFLTVASICAWAAWAARDDVGEAPAPPPYWRWMSIINRTKANALIRVAPSVASRRWPCHRSPLSSPLRPAACTAASPAEGNRASAVHRLRRRSL